MASFQFKNEVVNFGSTIIIFLPQLFHNAKLYILRKGSGRESLIIQIYFVALECLYMNNICISEMIKDTVAMC